MHLAAGIQGDYQDVSAGHSHSEGGLGRLDSRQECNRGGHRVDDPLTGTENTTGRENTGVARKGLCWGLAQGRKGLPELDCSIRGG